MSDHTSQHMTREEFMRQGIDRVLSYEEFVRRGVSAQKAVDEFMEVLQDTKGKEPAMTTETKGYTLAWIGFGLMLLGGVMYLWRLL